jgi:hypothetical protein
MPQSSDPANFDVFDPDKATAIERIPYAMAAVKQQVSLLYGNYPQPQYISPSANFDKYAEVLNQNAQIEYKANGLNSLMFDLGMDVAYAGFGVLKAYVDTDEPGPFGKDGKIIIRKMDPAKISVDPKAKRLKWCDLQYIIVEEELDLGTARRMYPGAKITEKMKGAAKPARDGMYGKNIISPVSIVGERASNRRDKVKILECWFKDDRLKFVAEEESIENRPEIINTETGLPEPNPDYDPEKPEIYDAPKVDEDGHVVGEWVPAYPDGRCIVLAGDTTVVQDFENPYWHRQAPFVFFRGSPSRKLMAVGDLTNIVKIDKKINDLMGRIHIMAQAEIERPIVADNRALRPPRMIYRLSGTATSVLVITPGSQFGRMPPTEIPQFPWVLLQRYDKAMDLVMAAAGITRGQVEEGSQLSAQAMSSLNDFAAGMLKTKAELIAEGMKDLGYQIQWLQRETYDDGIEIPISMPDGTTETVNWNQREAKSDYIMGIESGTGLPGAMAQQSQFGLSLWDKGLIDRTKALQMARIDDWQTIVDRIKTEEASRIQTDAFGRALGLYVKKLLLPDLKEKDAGRREAA